MVLKIQKMKQIKKVRGKTPKLFGIFSSGSGTGAVAGAHNVCHALCTAVAAALATIGITISSTSLMFLETLAPYFWLMGAVFFIASLSFLYFRKHGSKKLLLFNFGILIAGIPFSPFKNFQPSLWIFGGAFILTSLIMYLSERRARKWKNR